MSRSKSLGLVSAIALALALPFVPMHASEDRDRTEHHRLTCGPHRTIGRALRELKPGDTLVVSGTCNENVDIGENLANITLDGQGTATIVGDLAVNAVTITGRGITIRGFTISGGFQGIAVTDGGAAIIDGNTIEHAAFNGITVFRDATANIINNIIQFNGSSGIQLQHSSSGRIGFSGPPSNRVYAPNTVQNNGAPGIQVLRGSSAQIFTNIIQNNASHGILVDRNGQAEISANTITGNNGDAVRGTRNAGVDLGSDAAGATPTLDDDTNNGANNTGFAIRCSIGGFVDGRIGALTGLLGASSFAENCTNSVQP